MTEAMQALPEDHPLMQAWRAYTQTDSFKNTRYWATKADEYVDGSLWAAFMAGWEMAKGATGE